MRGIWSNKLLFWNFVILFAIKSLGVSTQLASFVAGTQIFSGGEIVASTNIYRASQGLPALKENSVLNTAAAQKLEDMIRNQYFAHYSPGGTSPWYWFQLNGYRYTYAGENLAIGYPDAATTVDAWVKSPSHRANLVSRNYRDIGVAVAQAKIQDDDGILVVQLFGTAAGSAITLSSSDAKIPKVDLSQSDASEVTPVPPRNIATPVPTEIRTPEPTFVAVAEPRTTSIQRTTFVSKLQKVLNSGFTTYTYILVILSLVYLLSREFRKELALKTALHFIVFWLAATLPLFSFVAGKIM